MKQFGKRLTALALAFMTAAAPAAAASEALGDALHGSSVPIGQDTVLEKQIFWSNTYSDLRTEHTVTWRPGGTVVPMVAYGKTVLSRATLDAMAREVERSGRRVISGINGDYYVVATGQPLGLVIAGGEIQSSDGVGEDVHYAVGFRADGSAFIGGKPGLEITLHTGSGSIAITGGINKIRTAAGGPVLLTDQFHTGTQNTTAGVNVVLTPMEEQGGVAAGERDGQAVALTVGKRLAVNSRVTCTVEAVTEEEKSTPIQEGKYILTMNAAGDSGVYEALKALVPGQSVDVDITAADPVWAEAECATGSLYKLVEDAQPVKGLPTEQTARSAIGIKADGTVVFYTIDGKRPGHSVGASLGQVALRLIELGCVEAACLDGGGSTTLGVTLPDSDAFSGVNRPADGSQRANSTAIFLTSDGAATGVRDHLYLTPNDGLLLSGAQVQMDVSGVDTAWHPMEVDGPVWYAVQNGDGTITTDGLFTAAGSGATTVTASAGDTAGSATFTVIDTPEQITVTREGSTKALTSLVVAPGEQVDLTAAAAYRKMALTAQDTCFVWTAEPSAGTVDENGVFTAAQASGSGSLTVSAGGRSVTIPVTVAGHLLELATFEENIAAFTGGTGTVLSSESTLDYVARGRHSLRMEYDASQGSALAGCGLELGSGERYMSLWIYGDASGNQLTAQFRCGTETREQLLTTLDFSGWRQVSTVLPEGAGALSGVRVIYSGGPAKTGTLWLDHFTTANEAVADSAAPVVTLSRDGSRLKAQIRDDVDRALDQGQISLTVDGKAQAFSWDASSGTLSATVAVEDGKNHRITVTARDGSGNLGRASESVLPEREDSAFVDTQGHWAAPYAQYLNDIGVSEGSQVDDGMAFYPGKEIVRGEFFTMVARWMVSDLSLYEGVELPYTDAATIPTWALSEMKAMYALGIVKGNDTGYLNFFQTVTRAETITVLGRTQAKGYALADLSGFADGGEVPGWAETYVRSLVGQGIVGGSGGRLNAMVPITRGEVAKLLMEIQ